MKKTNLSGKIKYKWFNLLIIFRLQLHKQKPETEFGILSAGIGAAVLVVAYIRVAVWLITSYRQTYKIRLALLQAVLRQEIGWFDTNDAGELGSRLSESVRA